MRNASTFVWLMLAVCTLASGSASAAAVLNSQDAADLVRAQGYPLVSKAEAAPGAWDVWASKDGIAYEIRIDAKDGSVLAAGPVEAND